MPKGARNPKTARLSLSVDDMIDARINRLADATGTNKGTMAAVVIAAGLTALEAVMLPTDPERQAEVAMHLARKVQGDVKQEVEHQKQEIEHQEQITKRPFKLELEQSERPKNEWSGYMAGL